MNETVAYLQERLLEQWEENKKLGNALREIADLESYSDPAVDAVRMRRLAREACKQFGVK